MNSMFSVLKVTHYCIIKHLRNPIYIINKFFIESFSIINGYSARVRDSQYHREMREFCSYLDNEIKIQHKYYSLDWVSKGVRERLAVTCCQCVGGKLLIFLIFIMTSESKKKGEKMIHDLRLDMSQISGT